MQGAKPDEVLEIDLKLPFAPGAPEEAPSDKAKDGSAPASKQSAPGQAQGTGGALLGKQRPGLGGLGTLLPRPRFSNPASPLLAPPSPALTDPQTGGSTSDGGHFMLRCGNLLMSAEVRDACCKLLPHHTHASKNRSELKFLYFSSFLRFDSLSARKVAQGRDRSVPWMSCLTDLHF